MKFNLKNSVLIPETIENDMTIASFNPRYDKIDLDDSDIMLDLPDREIIIDQTTTNSCVGHSIVMCSAILHYAKTNKWIDFDPFVVYGTIKGDQWDGMGMFPTDAIQNCIDDGFYFRRDFNKQGERPEIRTEVEKFKVANPALVEQAKQYALTGRATVYNAKTVRQALELGMPVSATWELYESFFTRTGDDGIVPVPRYGNEEYVGNHQMTIVGIKDNKYYIVINSYGKDYGFKGMYFIPFDYNFTLGFAISDTIIPAKRKAEKVVMKINDPNVIIDDKIVISDVSPVIVDDRTMIPLRIVSEALGASVEWNEATQMVTVRSEEGVITMKIGINRYTVDKNQYTMDTAPIIMNDRTLVPIRFISEALNCEISWDQDKYEATITCL